MKLVEAVKRKFVHLNLAYSFQIAAPTIGAACTTAETTTKMSRALKKRLNTNNIVYCRVNHHIKVLYYLNGYTGEPH